MPEGGEHWELIRALGAVVLTPPPGNAAVCAALDLPPQAAVEHTEVFVLSAPPHAAIHLGPEGMLGGEGLDRVAGFWRALHLPGRDDADHLGALLMLYAELGAAELASAAPADEGPTRHDDAAPDRVGPTSASARSQLRHTRRALFHEHIFSWAPGYLQAVSGLGVTSVSAWAELLGEVLIAEAVALGPADPLPLALRTAGPALTAVGSFDETLDILIAPVRSGMILTQRDLAAGAAAIGVGYRRGERRFVLKSMFEQDPPATLAWVAGHADTWARRHRDTADRTAVEGGRSPDPTAVWWARRAEETAAVLSELAAEAAHPASTTASTSP